MKAENKNGPNIDPCGTPAEGNPVERATPAKAHDHGSVLKIGVEPSNSGRI